MRNTWSLAALGIAGLVAAFAADTHGAGGAASQDWPPFVLVAGLLLIGLVAADDGLFESAGAVLDRLAAGGVTLYAGAIVLIGVVTAVLNLDTSVAFLTPVLVHASRRRRGGGDALLYGSLMLANAGSLFLPGSNLTNLIVTGHLHVSGAEFFSRMWAPALVALVVTAVVVALCLPPRGRRERASDAEDGAPRVGPVGLVSVVAAVVLVLVLRNPALPVAVAGVGVVAAAVQIARRRLSHSHVVEALGAPVLVGLFGIAVALGTAGRAWSGPETLLSHLGTWATAAVAAVASVVFNNLPAASLLAARPPAHPFSLLVGLNLGPNLLATGSLAWFLWARAARTAGAEPSLWRASKIGVLAAPLSIVAAMGVLSLTGHS